MPDGSNRTETYGYDELDRLTSVDYGDTRTQSYGFDPMGNRTQKVDSVSVTENSTDTNADRLLAPVY
jgi:YD repeat-containing protein